LWKAVVSSDGDPQQAFFRFKEAIDAYCASSLFTVSAVAGVIIVQRPMEGEDPRVLPGARYWRRFPRLDSLWSQADAGTLPNDSATSELDVDFDGDESVIAPVGNAVASDDSVTAPRPVVGATETDEDSAIGALLDRPSPEQGTESNLDALLDQVLEFDTNKAAATAASTEGVEELDDDEVELVHVDPHRPGETLKRIRALLPPPRRMPPPPPRGGGRKK